MGQTLAGSGLFHPFDLPPQAFHLVDWKTGRALVLTATPETNLYSLFAGYKSAEGQSMSEGAVKVAVHRLRERYRERLKAEIAHTVAAPADVDAELRHLFRVLSRS